MAGARITVRLPRGLYDKAMAKAKREDITVSQIVRRYLREWIKEGGEEVANERKPTQEQA